MTSPRTARGFLRALLRREVEDCPTDEKHLLPIGPSDSSLLLEANEQLYSHRRSIDTSLADPAISVRFMERVIAQWRALGEAEPFWSNDTRDEFKRENLTEEKIEDFYAGGRGAIDLIKAFESRSDVNVGDGVCMELGCGVGKHTQALAKRFRHVFAIDVAAAGLAVCEQRMKVLGLDNVTTVLLTSLEDLSRCGDCDVFFSLSVLQHNPPPLQTLLIATALEHLKPSGFCLFQTPDWLENYTFSSQRFLEAGEAMFDLHCLPKTEVLSLLDRSGMRLLDFAPDFTLGHFGSYTYFARKR